MSASDDLIKEIRKETERRKQVWKKVEEVAKEAMAAAQKEAKKQGIQGMDWFTPAFPFTESAAIWYRVQINKGNVQRKVDLLPSGEAVRPSDLTCSDTYQNYPDLTELDISAFQRAAVEELVGMINRYKD